MVGSHFRGAIHSGNKFGRFWCGCLPDWSLEPDQLARTTLTLTSPHVAGNKQQFVSRPFFWENSFFCHSRPVSTHGVNSGGNPSTAIQFPTMDPGLRRDDKKEGYKSRLSTSYTVGKVISAMGLFPSDHTRHVLMPKLLAGARSTASRSPIIMCSLGGNVV